MPGNEACFGTGAACAASYCRTGRNVRNNAFPGRDKNDEQQSVEARVLRYRYRYDLRVRVKAAEKKYDPGASDTEIKLGQTVPHSGPGSLYGVLGRVGEAYFQMLNEKGGINGRKVKFFHGRRL